MRKQDKSLQVTVRHYVNCITINLERDGKCVTVRSYNHTDCESQKAANDFASALADITKATWLTIDRSGLTYNRPFVVASK